MNALDLTSLANVKSWLGIKGADFDDDLGRLITAISAFAQSFINGTIAQATYVEKRSGHGGDTVVTANQPLVSVTSIVMDGTTVPSANYTFDEDGIYMTNGRFNRAKNNLVLTYVAGYATTPFDLEQAIIETVAVRWKERERIGMTSKSLAGETTAFMIKDFPPSSLSILHQYKKVLPLS